MFFIIIYNFLSETLLENISLITFLSIIQKTCWTSFSVFLSIFFMFPFVSVTSWEFSLKWPSNYYYNDIIDTCIWCNWVDEMWNGGRGASMLPHFPSSKCKCVKMNECLKIYSKSQTLSETLCWAKQRIEWRDFYVFSLFYCVMIEKQDK